MADKWRDWYWWEPCRIWVRRQLGAQFAKSARLEQVIMGNLNRLGYGLWCWTPRPSVTALCLFVIRYSLLKQRERPTSGSSISLSNSCT